MLTCTHGPGKESLTASRCHGTACRNCEDPLIDAAIRPRRGPVVLPDDTVVDVAIVLGYALFR